MNYTVTNAMKTREYAGKYGTMHSYAMQLEGVDATVELSQKPETAPPKSGDTLDGTIEDTQYGKRFKKAQPANSFSGGTTSRQNDPDTRASIERQSALKAAVETVRDYYTWAGITIPKDKEAERLSVYVNEIANVTKTFTQVLAGTPVVEAKTQGQVFDETIAAARADEPPIESRLPEPF